MASRKLLKKHRIQLVIHYDPVVTDDAELNEMRTLTEQVVQELDPRFSLHDFRMVRGSGHTNLVFDLVIPFELHEKRREIAHQVNDRIKAIDQKYNVVITFDH